MSRRSRHTAVVALAWLIAAASLGGCGFELRGSANLPSAMQKTRLEAADPTSLFTRELELLLRANGAQLVDAPADDAARLQITRQSITRRALTISGDARVREFELVFDLRFDLLGPAGESLLQNESLRLARDFQFDEQEILSATTEEERIRENLQRDMAAALIRRLEAFGRT